MAKINSLRDIIQFNSNFKTAINLYLSLNKAEKVLGYIPTKSSVSFLGEYLKAVLENKEQATLLVGPYGKGKSHLLLVLLAVLSMKKTPESESAINELIDNVSKTDEVGERVSEYIGQVWDKKRFLPVLITDTTGDLNQAFLYGLNDALKRDGLLDLAPETYYSIAWDRIDDWEQNYFETYKMFERELTQNGMSIAELKTDLKQYSQKTLILFKEIYPKVTAGSEFNPMALADALPLYKSVSEKLVDEYGYSGIYIVFDEFSKFIEGQNNIAAGTNMHLLQSMCELATDSKNAQVFITMVGLYGEAREDNEIEFSIDVGMIISQLEIYDQIWFVRHMPKKGEHSREAKELVTEIIARLEDIPDGCAECFPFELIDELKQEYLTDNSL